MNLRNSLNWAGCEWREQRQRGFEALLPLNDSQQVSGVRRSVGSSRHGAVETNPTRNHRFCVPSLASLSG